MFLFYFVVWICHLNFNSPRAKVSGSLTNSRNRWYGPSYQPSWWNPDSVLGLRAGNFAYDGPNEYQATGKSTMRFCRDNISFKAGAFEGSMIGLSIGVVLGSIRAISLDGVPHYEDETRCKTLITHIIGGLISGALVGLVYVFFEGCVFK